MRHLIALLPLVLFGCATGSGATREPSTGALAETTEEQSAAPVTPEADDASEDDEAAQTPEAAHDFMSLGEILVVLKDSPREYHIIEGVPGTYTNEVWPVGDAPTPSFRVVVDASGHRSVQPATPLPRDSQRLLDAAEEAFRSRRFKEAEEGYRRVLKRHPDDFTVQLVLGDALLFQDKAAEALAAYERGATLHPRGYSAWFFQASALIRLQRFDEAADRYARALALRPSWPSILQAIESNGRHVNRQVAPPILKPRAHAALDGEAIVVSADPKSFAWTAHAICKAMWLGEAELRARRIQSDAQGFTYLEEGECLSVLLAAHRKMRAKEPDPALDRALQIAEEGYLAELVSYEILARVVPMAIPTLDDAMLERLHEYVERYVLVPREPPTSNPD